MRLPRRRASGQSATPYVHRFVQVAPPILALALAISSAGLAGQTRGSLRTKGGAATSDWLKWGGPRGNFTTDTVGLPNSWPEGGPKRLWTRELGGGHSSILKEGGRLYTMYRPYISREENRWKDEEVVIALDASTGRTIWEHHYPAPLEGMRVPRGAAGPHSTPLIVGGRLFATGSNKQVIALDKQTGKVIWTHDLVKEYNAPPQYMKMPDQPGYHCSPLAYKDLVIVTAGGPNQTLMAFRQDDGRLMWRSGDFLPAPASPILITVEGQDQIALFAGQHVAGFDPVTGAVLWSHPSARKDDANATTPIWSEKDNLLFISSAMDGGSRMLEVTKSGVKERWFNLKMRVYFGTVVRIGDYYYGSSGDLGPAFLTAINAKTGEVAWQSREFARCNFLYADGKLIVVDEDGNLGLATVSGEGLKVLAKSPVLTAVSWSVPTLVGTTLYIRDRVNIMAFDLAGSSS